MNHAARPHLYRRRVRLLLPPCVRAVILRLLAVASGYSVDGAGERSGDGDVQPHGAVIVLDGWASRIGSVLQLRLRTSAQAHAAVVVATNWMTPPSFLPSWLTGWLQV
jgi:hypothetical protein